MAISVPAFQEPTNTLAQVLDHVRGVGRQRQQDQIKNALLQQQAALIQQKMSQSPERERLQNLLTQARTTAIPEQTRTAAQNVLLRQGQLAQSQSRFSRPEYLTRQWLSALPAATRAAVIAKNPNLAALVAQGNIQRAAAQFRGVPQQQGVSPAQGVPIGGQPGDQNIINQILTGGQQQQPMQPAAVHASQVPPSGIPAVQVPAGMADAIKSTAEMSANKALTPTTIQARLYSAKILDSFLADPRIQKVLGNATDAAGLYGKGKLFMEGLRKNQPEKYRDYQEFIHSIVPDAINQVKKMEGLGATDKQRDELRGKFQYGLDNIYSNPVSALDSINRGFKEMRALSKSISTAAQPAFPGALERATGATKPLTFSPGLANKLAGMSEEDLKKIGARK